MKVTMSIRHRRAFTLIELLVVISVIGILAGMLMPAISLVRESSRKANCGSNQRQIVLSMVLYTTEYRKWPDHGSGGADRGAISQGIVLAKLGDDHKVYICPSMTKAVEMRDALRGAAYTTWSAGGTIGGTSYTYDYETPFTAKPGRVVMADWQNSASETAHKKTAIACFADGHVGNINRTGSSPNFKWPNPDANDLDIYSGTASATDANVR